MSDSDPKLLYHYTAPITSHLGSILADGRIRTTKSNLSSAREHGGPDVVWLTDSDNPGEQEWVTTVSPWKRLAVLVVELDPSRVHHWPEWSRAQGIDEVMYSGSVSSGGDPSHWWVSTTPIQKWDIRALVIAPLSLEGGQQVERRAFADEDLSRLFRSAGARGNLGLPETKMKRA